jgi:predicted DsbA family dithiol-disulfide isomerase
MKVEIWSDVVCPWCFVGKRNFERALADFPHADALEVTWRSYELDPRGPAVREGTYAERIARKYGMDVGQARASMARMVNVGAEAGIDFKFDTMRPGNTFNAHRLLHFAKLHNRQHELKEALFNATFTECLPIGTDEALESVAVSVGLEADDVRGVLASEQFADEVRFDERVAQNIGITGVPFFLVDDAYGIPGAQDPQVYRNILDRAWAETHRSVEIVAPAGDACDDDVCDI